MLSSRAVKAALLLFLSFLAGPLCAATIAVEVKDARGAPLENTAVWAMPKSGAAPRVRREATIEQVQRQFVPLVSVVQTGTQVNFPNRDEIRHHVYSFSTPKPFEIKLYGGTTAPPQTFDKPGEVVLGCNIHDTMIAYLYIVDSPWLGKTGKDGRVRLEGLPAGDFEVHARHYAQSAVQDAKTVKLRADETASVQFAIASKALLIAPAPAPTK